MHNRVAILLSPVPYFRFLAITALSIVVFCPVARAQGRPTPEQSSTRVQITPLNYEQALPALRDSKDRKSEAILYENIAAAQTRVDPKNPEKAVEAYLNALSIYRELKDRESEAGTLNLLGVTHANADQPGAALPYYEQALVLYRDLKDRRSEAIVQRNIAVAHTSLWIQDEAAERWAAWGNEKRQAAAAFEKCVAIDRELNDKPQEMEDLIHLALTWKGTLEYQKAAPLYERAASIAHDMNDRRREAELLNSAGEMSRSDDAAGYFERALKVGREIKYREPEALSLTRLGDSYSELKQYPKAIESYLQALTTIRDLKDRSQELKVLSSLADVQSRSDQHEQALQNRQTILSLLETKDPAEMAGALNAIAAEYAALKQFEKSVEIYRQALALYQRQNDETKEAGSLLSIALSQMQAGQAADAVDSADQAIAIWERLAKKTPGWSPDLAGSLDLRDFPLVPDDWFHEAVEYYHSAAVFFRQSGNRQREAAMYAELGIIKFDHLQRNTAIEMFSNSAAIYREIGDRNNQASILVKLGEVQRTNVKYADALNSFREALTIVRDIGDTGAEAYLLSKTGRLLGQEHASAQALPYFEKALAIRRTMQNRALEATALVELGDAHRTLNHSEKAVELYQQAISIQRGMQDRQAEADTLFLLGRAYWRMGQEGKVTEVRQQALAIYRELHNVKEYANILGASDLLHEGRYEELLEQLDENVAIAIAQKDTILGPTLIHSLGVGYGRLNSRDKAIKYLEMALAMNRQKQDRRGEGHDLDDLGYTYANSGDPTKALEYHAQSLSIGRETGDEALQALALNNTGAAYRRLGDFQRAAEYGEQALLLMRQHNRELTGLNLYNLAGAYRGLKQYDKSMECLNEALTIFRDYQNPHGMGAILTEMMFTAKAAEHPGIAILYGKQAVNELQTIRGRIVTLDAGTQKDFVQNFAENTYRVLADLLVDQGRILEAQQVLGMLKEREYFDFIRRDGEADALSTRAGLTPREIAYDKASREGSGKVTALGTEFEKLRTQKSRTPDEEARFHELRDQLAHAQRAFRENLEQIRKQLDASGDVAGKSALLAELGNSQALMADLRDLGTGTVALYTLVGTDKYRVILVTPQAQAAREYPIGAAALARKVAVFREALQHPQLDPRPAAHELYTILFAPIEKELEGANAQTIMWSLDGVLRYVPVNALYDGNGWLVARYRNVIFTPASKTRLKDSPSSEWKALALGVSRQVAGFPAVPAVRDEIKGIVRDPKTGQSGVLPGDIQLDQTFTKSSMLDALLEGSHPVVHIASHFNFQPGTEVDSYLLLGDGGQFNLAELRDQSALFSGVDLLTLSACNTAMGGGGDDGGREVEGFAMLAQAQGAKAVLATLWPVADESTGLLMREFYRLKQENPTTPKIEALRQAQLEFVTGGIRASGSDTQRSAITVRQASATRTEAPRFQADPKAPFAHPYFWAPFIMIGNWR